MIDISKKECYKTVAGDGEAVFTDRKSKFIAHVHPAENEEEALAFLAEMRSRYSDARHNVYAYIIDENNIFRYSDDGEPSGTSGMPVLDTMRKEGLVDVITVVTRYFGGTLLGTGGLVHAYGTAARMGLESAGIVTRALCGIYKVKCDYTLAGKLQYHFAEKGYMTEDTVYTDNVEFTVCLLRSEIEGFISEVTDISGGRAVIKPGGEKYTDIREDIK